ELERTERVQRPEPRRRRLDDPESVAVDRRDVSDPRVQRGADVPLRVVEEPAEQLRTSEFRELRVRPAIDLEGEPGQPVPEEDDLLDLAGAERSALDDAQEPLLDLPDPAYEPVRTDVRRQDEEAPPFMAVHEPGDVVDHGEAGIAPLPPEVHGSLGAGAPGRDRGEGLGPGASGGGRPRPNRRAAQTARRTRDGGAEPRLERVDVDRPARGRPDRVDRRAGEVPAQQDLDERRLP